MTSFENQPLQVQRKPNFDNLRRTLLRQGPPGPVPFAELFADPGTMESLLGEKFPLDLHSLVLASSNRPEPGAISIVSTATIGTRAASTLPAARFR